MAGLPGRLMMRLCPRITATWRERMAVGTNASEIWRICSPKPGISLSATASVASGVTVAQRRARAASGQHQAAARIHQPRSAWR